MPFDRDLLAELQSYTDEIGDLARRIEEDRPRRPPGQGPAQEAHDEAQAFRITNLYCSFERIFERIAIGSGADLPVGPDWHQVLLRRMATDVPEVRPAVISVGTRARLWELLAFRHAMRHLYGGNVAPDELERLLSRLGETTTTANREVEGFIETMGRVLHGAEDEGGQ